MRRKWVVLVAATMVAATACSGQSEGERGEVAAPPSDPAKVSGEITVLTNRTDQISDGTLKKYADEFGKVYPRVKVKFEGLTDYEGETKIRMNTENYGDVLLIPNSLSIEQYPNFFAPLGEAGELSKKFDYTDHATVDGKVYGLSNIGVANGFVYNKAVWAKAGITDWPATPEEFVADLETIKSKTDAVPYYTNYKDGWPLTNWTNGIGSPECDPGAYDSLATTEKPWSEGSDLYAIDKLLYTIVDRELAEPDPTTTNWEDSKSQIGTGKVASMWLGSWAISQTRAAAEAAGENPDDLGFMPFPGQKDGKFCSVLRPDYQYAVNTHSDKKAAARAWIDWYITKSGQSAAEGSISSVKGAPLPDTLEAFSDNDVTLIPQHQRNKAEIDGIDKASEIGITSQQYRQKLVDVARGAADGDMDSYFAELNGKWAEARQTLGG
ncbi:ABC transporter substrate-binding protein [Streptomyces poonensis]|uniref:Sugar ABC transporter substrate-binding protein n=1 Tax=Streptomyces poonensis TaxID=68255 RepID=A0A918PE05_9ACTN|nr:ABC transporter substrate-binding protein [Streptomyces poonensis]GGZ02937.1 sugar ABC transporter substrate-binding protein [Streptomyces poonensis]GLJ93864.1 sugar ABC transporter substrate-binding protein [Streptomyces poonensis]